METVSTAKPNPLLALDPVLGPCWKARQNLSPEARLLALLTRSLTNDPVISAPLLKIWAKSRLAKSDPGLVALVENKWHWKRLKAAAAKHLESVQSSTSLLPVRAARRTLSRILTPVILDGDTTGASGLTSARQTINARHHLAALGLEAIRSATGGKEVMMIGDAWVGVHRNCTVATARKYRHLVTTEKWVRLVSGGKPGATPRLRMTQLTGQARRVAEEHYDSIGRLASGEYGQDQLAAFIGTATHPAWTYGGLGTSAWLVAVADAADVDPVTLGVPARQIPPIRKKILTPLYARGETVEEMLDAHALETGAFYDYQAAVAKRQAEAAARKVEVERARAQKAEEQKLAKAQRVAAKKAKPALGTQPVPKAEPSPEAIAAKLVTMIGPVPGPQPETAMSAWIASAKPLLDKCTPEQRRGMAKVLAPQAQAAGWDSAMTQRFSSIIVG